MVNKCVMRVRFISFLTAIGSVRELKPTVLGLLLRNVFSVDYKPIRLEHPSAT